MEQNKISGVYKITNNITGDFYIGSSKNIKQRSKEIFIVRDFHNFY